MPMSRITLEYLTQFFKFFARVSPDYLSQLLTFEMPFGKYKGRVIADLPGHYLNWFAREGFPPGELGKLLALMHELDHNGLSDLLIPLRNRTAPMAKQSQGRA